MRKLTLIVLAFSLASCGTLDIESSARNSRGASADGGIPETAQALVFPEIEVIVVERPVFVPESESAQASPPSGQQAVRESNRAGIVQPSEYSRAAMVYDYSRDWVYEVYTQPLRVSDISLEPGERAVEAPFISDSERWIIGAGISYENGIAVQHIYVKPAAPSLEASLIINTDRRSYHIILRSYRDIYMPIVRWRYPPAVPSNFMRPQDAAPAPEPGGRQGEQAFSGADPRFLSFNYRIAYSLFRKPPWMPELVFDDGAKTYIAFPRQALQRQLPAVFENRSGILNFRVIENVIVIDKLIESITVKLDGAEITITKKRGANAR